MTATIWMYDDPKSGYHDSQCQCPGHCGNCFEDLATIRALCDRLIAEGTAGYTDHDRLHPLARYCSPYCKGRAARDRALDQALSQQENPR